MGLTVIGKSGEVVPIQLQLNPRDVGLFPRAKVFDEVGTTPIATVNLSHVEDGLYRGAYQIPSADKFLVSFEIFSDAGHSIELTDDYTVSTDLIVANLDPLPSPPVVAHAIDPARIP